jgi:hypothetical protein
MKKIIYLVSLAIMALLTSCDYNAQNFPGYLDGISPTNVASYSYTLVASDYTAIATAVKKPVNDSITLMKNQLKIAVNATDSAAINSVIAKLNLQLTTVPKYIAATAISTNKIFADSTQFINYIPIILNSKYLYGDEKSRAAVTFNLNMDTTKIAAVKKFTLSNFSFDKMGITLHDFSSTVSPDYYLPIFLKDSFKYAVAGDIRMVRYKYYYSSSNVPQLYGIYTYNGTSWVNYSSSSATLAKFTYKSGSWVFVNSEILIEKFVTDFGTFTPQIVVGTYTWTHGTFNGGCIVANAYQKGPTEIWMTSPTISLKDRINPTVSFDHAINYGNGLPVTDLAGCYVSTNYTGDVTTATWTKLDIVYPTTFSWTFLNSGKVSLKTYVNKNINIAFKYVSTGTAIGWEVSNVNVLDE